MFDDHHGIAALCQTMQYLHQFVHICKMQSCGGLIQNIDRPAGTAFAQFCCQFDSLSLAAGQRSGRLAQFYIGKSHIIKRLYFIADRRNIFKKSDRFLHSHIQHVINAFAFVFYFQCFPVISFTFTHFTWHIYIRQKMHFYLDDTVTAAGFAPAALYIEAETALFVAFGSGILGSRIQVPDLVEYAGIGGRIRAGCPANGRLVDIDHLVQMFHAFNTFVPARNGSGAVQCTGQCLVQNFVDKRTFSGAGHTCNTGHNTQRKPDGNLFQVVFCGFPHGQITGRLSAAGRNRDPAGATQILPGNGTGHLHNLFRRPAGHNLASMRTGTRPDVHNVICFPHGIFIVLHHNQCISQIPQVFQRSQKFVIVSLMESDAGLIQNIAHPHQSGTDLGGQADALGFSAGKSAGGSGQRQIVQPHVHQKSHSRPDFLQHLPANKHLLPGKLHVFQKSVQGIDGHGGNVVNIFITDCYGKGFFFQALAFTFFTGGNTHESLILLLHHIRAGLSVTPFHIFDQSLKGHRINPLPPLSLIIDHHFFSIGAVEQDMSDKIRIRLKRGIQTKPVFHGQRL